MVWNGPTILIAALAFVAGAVVAWLAVSARARAAFQRLRLETTEELSSARASLVAERNRREELGLQIDELRREKDSESRELVALTERMEFADRRLAEQRQFLEDARRELADSFQALAATALRGNNEEFLRLAEERWKSSREQVAGDLEERRRGIETLLAPLRETLGKLESRTGDIERAREGAYRGLEEQLRDLRQATAALEEKTTTLASALRGSGAQGRWGEVALRNVVELAGMSEHVDFVEQQETPDRRRPDMIVRLPGGRFIAVDAKVPFNAYLESTEATSARVRERALDRHVTALRSHVRTLAARDYAGSIEGTLDLVVLFLPGDPFLAAAFERAPDLQVEALREKVLVATPTTLVALLRTVAIYWQQRSLAENAEEIANTARLLYERAALFGEHLARVGKGLDGAVDAFNQAVGSFERRVLPLGRQLESLKVSEQAKRALASPAPVDEEPRTITGRPEDGED